MVGIKGSGMSSLALYLQKRGSIVSGWDTQEIFTTQDLLLKHSIDFSHTIPSTQQLSHIGTLIYSSAYNKNHPIISMAIEMNIPIYSYYEALSLITSLYPSYGVSGTHGKTTSVVAISHLLKTHEFPHDVICGTSIEEIGYESKGLPLIIEACEYQDHFLLLILQGLFITNVEYEHVDYFMSEDDVFSSFYHLIDNVPTCAPLICNRDEKGIPRIINYVEKTRKDLIPITYGKGEGNHITYVYPYKGNIHSLFVEELETEYITHLVGDENVSDQIGAALLCMMIMKKEFSLDTLGSLFSSFNTFKGAKGRVQRISKDSHPFYLYTDYAHHPSEMRSSLQSIRLLHPQQKFILIFFPHTVSRMSAFFEDFISSLSLCDTLIIFPVALSARTDGSEDRAKEISKALATRCNGFYVERVDEAMNTLTPLLKNGDVCITMGAGNTHAMNNLLLTIKELPV